MLCPDGVYPYPGTAPRPIDPLQVEIAIQFLAMLTPTRTARIGSSTLKHLAEKWGRRYGVGYISRGAITVAAVALGLAVKTYSPWFVMNPHVAIGVSLKDLKRINIEEPRKTKRLYGR